MSQTAPLSGVRVLDLTRSIAGPWMTRMLADAGADVIKIEPPGGDFMRLLPASTGEFSSGYFWQANAGKRSVCINLHSERGISLLWDLVPRFDVIVHNMRPNAARRLGFIAGRVHDVNPNAVFCHISGYGEDSRHVEKPGQDLGIQCMTGIAELTGVKGGEPAVPIWSLIDTLTSAYAYAAVCAALHARSQLGLTRIEIGVVMSQCGALLHDVGPFVLQSGLATRVERSGQFHPFLVPRGVIQVADGVVAVSAFRGRHWARLAPLLGGSVSPVASFRDRLAAKDQIESALIKTLSPLTVVETLAKLRGVGIPAYEVHESLEAVDASRLFHGRGLLVEKDDATLVSNMMHPETCSSHILSGAPRLGEATFDLLSGLLHLTGEEVLALLAEGIIDGEPAVIEELVSRCSARVGEGVEGVA